MKFCELLPRDVVGKAFKCRFFLDKPQGKHTVIRINEIACSLYESTPPSLRYQVICDMDFDWNPLKTYEQKILYFSEYDKFEIYFEECNRPQNV